MITAPNQLWQTDITYVYIAEEDRFLYLQAIMDVCDRMIIAYHIGLSCKAADVVRTVQQAVAQRQPEWDTPPFCVPTMVLNSSRRHLKTLVRPMGWSTNAFLTPLRTKMR